MIRLPARVVRLGFVTVAFLSLAFAVTGCGGGNDAPSSPSASSSRNLKYEITGSYSGALSVAYTAESNAIVGAEILPLPWSKSVTFPPGVAGVAGVAGVGIAGSSVVGRFGVQGQMVTVRIYCGSTVLRSQVATTASIGLLSLPSLAYVLS